MDHVKRLNNLKDDIKSVINVYVDGALSQESKIELTEEILAFVDDIVEDVYSEGYTDGYEICEKELGE